MTEETLESVTKETEDALYSKPEEKVEETVETETEEASKDEVKEVPEKQEKSPEKKEEIEYKLELKKETLLDNSFLDDVKSFAKENNLSNEQAQQVLSKQEEAISKYLEKEEARIEKELDEWRDSVVNDPDMGGDKLAKTAENARRVVERFGTDSFINLLKDTGYGDHPEVVRFLSKVGSLMSDDSLILPKAAETRQRSIEEVFYGKQN